MSEEIITALIGVAGSGIGSLIGIICNTKLTNYRLEQLEKKVDKHNQVVDRMYEAEKSISVIQEDVKVANRRIEDLENERK